jgi:Trk-type K+ transport system membrane component
MNQLLPRPHNRSRSPRFEHALDILLALTGVLAIATLVLDDGGFSLSPGFKSTLHIIEGVIVGLFAAERLVRLWLARDRRWYLGHHWFEYALLALVPLVYIIEWKLRRSVLSASVLFLVTTQVYILAVLVIRALGLNLRLSGSGIPPQRLLIGSFAVLVLIGSGLLMLPAAVQPANDSGWEYADALFTAVSAGCVTGLVVVDTGTHFTLFGQALILALIQFGGLGIMLFGTVFAMLVGSGLTLRGSDTLGQMVASDNLGDIGRVATFVVLTTLAVEAAGAAMLYPMFAGGLDALGQPLSTAGAVWHSVFHSVSAFCNAGFSLYGDSLMHGTAEGWDRPLDRHWQTLGVFAPLIVLGGIGFPVLRNCGQIALSLVRRRHWPGRPVPRDRRRLPRVRLNLHTRVALAATALLIPLGAAGLWFFERLHGGRLGIGQALFQSVTARTAGFNTIDIGALSPAGKLLICGLMSVGGSPASTAGGLKTVTLAVLVLAVWNTMRRRREFELFQRTVSSELVSRIVALTVLYLALLAAVTLALATLMPGIQTLDLFFEACSACGTVGLTTGITASLTPGAKLIIMAAMFAGRIGPLTMLMALTTQLRPVDYSYPTEHVIIG